MTAKDFLREKYGLTEREVQVAVLVYRGLADKEIAQRLGISHYTVKNHVKNILVKMNVRNRIEVSYAMRNQMTLRTNNNSL